MLKTIVLNLLHDPVHVYLLAGDILATFAVGFGIIWEHGPPDVRDIANKLVIGGVILETVCSVLIFVYDEGISGTQQSRIESQQATIISLQNRLAARSLTDAQVVDIIEQLKPFAGQHFDIVTYWRNPESVAVTNRIYGALISAGWLYDRPPSGEFILGVETGVVVLYDNRSGEAVAKAVKAFVYALLTNDLYAAVDPQAEGAKIPDSQPVSPKITINVGIKP